MSTPTSPVRLPGDPIPPPPEPRYPWRVAATMVGLVALVLLVVWLGFQAVKGPETSGQFPTAPTATAYALAFQATVSAIDTAEPRPTRPPTPQPTVAPTQARAANRASTTAPAPNTVGTGVPADTAGARSTSVTAAVAGQAIPQPTPASEGAGADQVQPSRTATVDASNQRASETPVPPVSSEMQQLVGAAYTEYWQG